MGTEFLRFRGPHGLTFGYRSGRPHAIALGATCTAEYSLSVLLFFASATLRFVAFVVNVPSKQSRRFRLFFASAKLHDVARRARVIGLANASQAQELCPRAGVALVGVYRSLIRRTAPLLSARSARLLSDA